MHESRGDTAWLDDQRLAMHWYSGRASDKAVLFD